MAIEKMVKKVMIVDDKEDSRVLAAKVLKRHGYEIVGASSGEEAISLAGREIPDLILMDVRLPGGISGLEATQRIKATPELRHIPIVAMTASVRPEDQMKALNEGCDGFIPKPIDIDALPGQVAGFINRGMG
ncbi:MAG: response regulator [Dehalococcoidia bacterium]|jgi:CheY-like chemotaxis protein